MFTNLMRSWLQQIRRSQFAGKPRRRCQRPSYGRSETLESRTVLVASISSIGTTALVSTTDDSAATGRDLGTLSSTPKTVNDFVGNADTRDYFRFNVSQTSDFRLQLTGLSSDADVRLQNAQGQAVAYSVRAGSASEDISRSLNAGTYFVCVYQYSGDTNYTLTLSTSAPSDNSMAGARDLGAISATATTVSDFVGSSDTQDYFRVTINQPSDVTLRLAGMTADADLQLLDAQGQTLASADRAGTAIENISRALDTGTYFVRVLQYSGDTNYTLTASAVASDNSLATARNLGAISTTPTTVREFVGTSDVQDYFRFTVPQSQSVSIRQVGNGYGADMQLRNASGQVVAYSTYVATATMGIDRMLDAGTYFVRAFQQYGDVTYDLTISAVVNVTNDNTIASARDLGTLGTTPMTVRDSVGSTDTRDYFRFTVGQTRNINLVLSNLTADADVRIVDAQGVTIASSMRWGSQSENISCTLAAGTYFVCVYQYSGDTNYDLTLS